MALLERPTHLDDLDAEALIKEARQRRRKRWLVGICVVSVAGLLSGILFSVSDHPPTATTRSATTGTVDSSRPYVNIKAFGHAGKLAFISQHNLWVLDGSKGSLREVATSYAIEPEFSPDGKWLAYVTTGPPAPYGNILNPPPSQLWIARSDGTAPLAIRGQARASQLSWSPTSDQLAVLDGATPGISLVTPNGVSHVIPGTSHAANFVWSPDGKAVAFSGYYRFGALETISITGGSPVSWQAEHNNPAYPLSLNPTIPARWLPNDEGILYWIDPDDSASIEADGLPLYLVRSPMGAAHLLTKTLADATSIATSRTGALAIGGGGDRYLWTSKSVERCSTDTATCIKVPMPASDVSIDPSWSPDGSQLVYAEGPNNGQGSFGQAAIAGWYSKLSLRSIGRNANTSVELR
ncbi:MAG TPA: hypothetical protein VG368_07975, partial [Acidimicrobiales bacterium]|nr:hypothetical protein [Acidimicrobiales bacterium]